MGKALCRHSGLLLWIAALAPSARAQVVRPTRIPTALPAAPCCTVTAIGQQTGIVSAKVNASGAAFQFQMTDPTQLAALRVGQGVYANFSTRQVSLSGTVVCCSMVTGTPAGTAISAAAANREPITLAASPALGKSTGSGSSTTTPPATGTSGTSANVVCAGSTTLRGVDVSVYQGTIDWKTVRDSGIAFAYARMGSWTARDAMFGTNYPAIKAAGLARGAYEVYDVAGSPQIQASAMMAAIGALQSGDLPPALDITAAELAVAQGNASGPTVVANINTWIADMKAATGLTPVVFLTSGALPAAASTLTNTPVWVGQWNNVQCPTLPAGDKQWAFWQHSGSGTVPGISTVVDLDTFNGNRSALKALAK